jgi:predicted dehydrogenase
LINRILIVGLGSIGKRHLRIARELMPSADIRVLRHKATNEISDYSNGSFSRLEEAVAFAPQLAVIANPAPFHISIAQALAENGVHLLVEKPLSVSLSGVTYLIETCRLKETALLTGYNLRFLPSLQYFRDALGTNSIGSVIAVHAEIGQYLPSWRPESDYRNGVSAKQELGGGVLLELSHELDYLRWIFGEVEWVTAELTRQSRLEIDVEDSAHLILGFSPTIGSHQLIGTINMDFIRHDTTRLCTAIGERGTLRWNGVAGEVCVFEQEVGEWRTLFSQQQKRDDSYLSQWHNFLACASGSARPVITGEDGLMVLEIIEAARISSAQNRKVPVASVKQPKGIHL